MPMTFVIHVDSHILSHAYLHVKQKCLESNIDVIIVG